MAAEKLTMNRIEELRDGSGIKKDEWDELFTLAKKQLEANAGHENERVISSDELINLRGTLRTNMENLRQCATKLAASDSARLLTVIDLATSETHCQSLIRRLQDAIAKEKTVRDWHEAYERTINDCIDHKPLPPVAQLNPTLLRLQEALGDHKADK